MKKISIFTILIVFIFSLGIFAHPPTEIKMDFNLENMMLEVIVNHVSQNSSDHYIHNVKVFLNDNLHIEQNFIAQFNKNEQYLHYIIPGVKSGDIIKLEAVCNKFGNRTAELSVQ